MASIGLCLDLNRVKFSIGGHWTFRLQKYYISSIRQKIHFNSDIIVINNLISVEIETNNFTEKMIFHLIYQE